MLLPVPSANPVAVPEVSAAVQVKVVPGVKLDRVMAVVPPGQKDSARGDAVTSGTRIHGNNHIYR
jgi:hypothetical protein